MTDIKRYVKRIVNETQYFPVLPTGQDVKLGDVGGFNNKYRFSRDFNLKDYGINFESRDATSVKNVVIKSSENVNVIFSGEADANKFQHIADAEAGARIEFNGEDEFVFSAPGCITKEIENKAEVKRQIASKLTDETLPWERNFWFVSDLLKAPSATIITAESSDAWIELEAEGNVGQEWYSLAGLHANAKFVRSKGTDTEIIAEDGVFPLFWPIRPKRSALERLIERLLHPGELVNRIGGMSHYGFDGDTITEEIGPDFQVEADRSEIDYGELENFVDYLFDEDVIDLIFEEPPATIGENTDLDEILNPE